MIIYRNGVGEAQKPELLKEYKQIEQARTQIEKMAECKFIYVMVNKRVKTKVVSNQNGRLMNPRAGTVLDHSILKKDAYDFFLISANCRVGVPTPSHYSVLKDEIGDGPEKIQALTYKLSYLYYNFSGAVKIPAPVKYAYRLATMVSERGNVMPHQYYD